MDRDKKMTARKSEYLFTEEKSGESLFGLSIDYDNKNRRLSHAGK